MMPFNWCCCCPSHLHEQVFIIAAREFTDFAVFLVYLLVLLGSAVFAFFQVRWHILYTTSLHYVDMDGLLLY